MAKFVCVHAIGACGASGDGADGGTAQTSGSEASSSGPLDATTGSETASSSGETGTPYSGPLTVMTFNVLCSFCDNTFDPWDQRVPYIGDTIMRHAPDLIGLQELVFADEVDQLLAAAPGYAAIYYGLDGERPYPDATILYHPDVLEPVDHGFYWLSPTPDEPRSTGFADGFQLPRLVTWTVLRRITDDAELFFATTHFDNNSPSQELSAPLLLERTAPFAAAMPAIVVGDFNARPDGEAYGILVGGVDGGPGLADSFDAAAWTMDTNLDPPPAYDTSQRIDHVFTAGAATWQVDRWTVDTWVYGPNERYISDHFAIVAELTAQ